MATHSHVHSFTPSLEPAPHTQGRVIRWAFWYDAVVNLMMFGHSGNLRAETMALAELKAGESVLDIGCGTGDIALRAREIVGATGKVMGLDASPEMINVARAKALDAQQTIDYRVGVVEQLPFETKTFDVVLSSLMMHHLPPGIKQAALQEASRVLKPQGRILIVDIKRPTRTLDKLSMAFVMHRALRQGVQDLKPLLESAGFQQIETGSLKTGALGYVRAYRVNS